VRDHPSHRRLWKTSPDQRTLPERSSFLSRYGQSRQTVKCGCHFRPTAVHRTSGTTRRAPLRSSASCFLNAFRNSDHARNAFHAFVSLCALVGAHGCVKHPPFFFAPRPPRPPPGEARGRLKRCQRALYGDSKRARVSSPMPYRHDTHSRRHRQDLVFSLAGRRRDDEPKLLQRRKSATAKNLFMFPYARRRCHSRGGGVRLLQWPLRAAYPPQGAQPSATAARLHAPGASETVGSLSHLRGFSHSEPSRPGQGEFATSISNEGAPAREKSHERRGRRGKWLHNRGSVPDPCTVAGRAALGRCAPFSPATPPGARSPASPEPCTVGAAPKARGARPPLGLPTLVRRPALTVATESRRHLVFAC